MELKAQGYRATDTKPEVKLTVMLFCSKMKILPLKWWRGTIGDLSHV